MRLANRVLATKRGRIAAAALAVPAIALAR